MAKKTSGAKKRAPLRMLIVEARFYEDIADALLAGATRVLDEAGAQLRPHHGAGRAGNSGRDRHGGRCRASASARPMTAWSRSAA